MVLLLNDAPLPIQDKVVQVPANVPAGGSPTDWLLTSTWMDFFNRLTAVVNESVVLVSSQTLELQGASIAATDFPGVGALPNGLYRVSWYSRVMRAAGTNSSLTVTIQWTDHGVPCSFSGAALVGNAIDSTQVNEYAFIRIDRASPIRYATTYASAGVPTMLYGLYLTIEKVSA